MSDLSKHVVDEARTRQRLPEPQRCAGCEGIEQRPHTGPSLDAGRLLSYHATGARANSIPRAAALQTMQRTHGNRAVQRSIPHSTLRTPHSTVPVQRFIAGAPYIDYLMNSALKYTGYSTSGEVGDVPVNISGTAEGKLGEWKDGVNTRYGVQAGGAGYKMKVNEGGDVSGDVGVLTGGGEVSAGDNGLTAGLGANLAEASLTLGDFGDTTDSGEKAKNESLLRFGLSAGVGAGGRVHWGDSDEDGNSEYGFGFDVGPVSADIKTEDPLRTGLGMVLALPFGPGGWYAADKGLEYLMGDTNMTDKAGEYGGKAYDYAADGLNQAGKAITDFGSDVYDTGSEMYNTAEEKVTETYNEVKEEAEKLYDDPEAYAEEKYEAASEYVEEQYEAVKEYIPDIEIPDVEYNPMNWF